MCRVPRAAGARLRMPLRSVFLPCSTPGSPSEEFQGLHGTTAWTAAKLFADHLPSLPLNASFLALGAVVSTATDLPRFA